MEKKFKFSEQPLTSKIVYGSVIAILCAVAIVVGIVAANSRKPETPPVPPISDQNENQEPQGQGQQEEPPVVPPAEQKQPVFIAPTVGTVITSHSLSVPIFYDTLREWRVHTGVDIETDVGATVFASADGVVEAIYNDPLYGITVEIAHTQDIKTVYSNLDKTLADGITVGKSVKAGDAIGAVGDSALCEMAAEPHLHFGIRVKNVAVNPLDYLTDESKSNSLGIEKTPTV